MLKDRDFVPMHLIIAHFSAKCAMLKDRDCEETVEKSVQSKLFLAPNARLVG